MRLAVRWTVPAALIAALTAAACANPFGGVNCTDEARPGLLVTVRDSVTDAAVEGARVTAWNLAGLDSAVGGYQGVYSLAFERAGTFVVAAERAGYRPWSRGGVRVTEDACHVRTVHVLVRLQPQP